MKKTRVLLVDDHQVVRRGIAAVVGDEGPDWEVCGEASTGREAVAARWNARATRMAIPKSAHIPPLTIRPAR